jgi:lysophospholipase L1-like esterase
MEKLLFWALAPLCLPLFLLWLQGLWVRGRVPRLAEAMGRRSGSFAGTGKALHLLVVGESPAVGVGLSHISHSMSVQSAAQLAQLTGRPVHWTVLGYSGAKLADLLHVYAGHIHGGHFDIALLVTGVNDATSNNSQVRFLSALRAMLALFRSENAELPVVMAGVPPLKDFPALPEPLASWLGWRARCIDEGLAKFAQNDLRLRHIPCGAVEVGEFAADGFHPDALASQRWALELGVACRDLLAGAD